jgi:hypothetical protein
VFHRVLEPLPVKQWQLEQTEGPLVLRIVPGQEVVAPESVVAAITSALGEADALPPPVRVELVDAIAKTPLGKSPLIKALSPRRGSYPSSS